ncbi:MAG: FtsH protease activity modulator HflK [Phycisphaerae bacterium]
MAKEQGQSNKNVTSKRGWPGAGTLATAAFILALVGYFASGVFFVQPDERGVVRWFGAASETTAKLQPGLHYALPWPFCKVDRPKTMEIRRLIIGMPVTMESSALDDQAYNLGNSINPQSANDTGSTPPSEAAGTTRLPGSYDMLSGDVNILSVRMVVQYQVSSPAAFLFNTADPDQLVRHTVRAVLIEQLAGMPVDQAFTGAKAALQFDTLRESQTILDNYGAGIQIVATDLEAIDPPEEVLTAFQDVVSAKKDGERAEDWAATAAARSLAQARGQAASRQSEAQSYAYSRVSRARGESTRFLSILNAYRSEPRLFRSRYELQALERVLPRVKLFVMDQDEGEAKTRVRIIDSKKGD